MFTLLCGNCPRFPARPKLVACYLNIVSFSSLLRTPVCSRGIDANYQAEDWALGRGKFNTLQDTLTASIPACGAFNYTLRMKEKVSALFACVIFPLSADRRLKGTDELNYLWGCLVAILIFLYLA